MKSSAWLLVAGTILGLGMTALPVITDETGSAVRLLPRDPVRSIQIGWWAYRNRKAGKFFANQLRTTTKIEFLKGAPGRREVVVTDNAEITKIISTIALSSALPCASGYSLTAKFQTEGANLEALIDDHSLVLRGGGRQGTFNAPSAFFKLFKSYVGESGPPNKG
ncbi:MAG: hypothetical protein WCU88_09885 [Elusimicrobiota bacterium]|jgi:hypothetical protein